MTNITKIIEDRAREYANVFSAPHRTRSFAGFTAGAFFATTDSAIIERLIKNFVDWMEKEYGTIQNPHWVLTKYIHHLQTNKQKEDGK